MQAIQQVSMRTTGLRQSLARRSVLPVRAQAIAGTATLILDASTNGNGNGSEFCVCQTVSM